MISEPLRSIDPATGATVGEVPVTPVEGIGRIVSAARRAQAGWGDAGVAARVACLRAAGPQLGERATELGRLITSEMGKRLRTAVAEVEFAAIHLASTLEGIAEAVAPGVVEDDRRLSVVHRDPLGVVAAIAPWNYPVGVPHRMLIPALAAGNAVVFKPSEKTPLVGQAYAQLLNEFLPAGVLEVVHGGAEQGRALVEGEVDLIVFTGSRAAGKQVLAAAAPTMKRVILELGGNDAMIVLEDADVAAAARMAAINCFSIAGQMCVATGRIYVHESVAADFVSALVDNAADWKVGNGLEDAVGLGPVVDAQQRDRVLGLVGDAISAGAVLAFDGDSDGLFLAPMVLTQVEPSMRIAQEETFGPVACVLCVASEDEAVDLANDTDFGLGAMVFGGEQRALAVARRLDAGMIGVNTDPRPVPGAPWVGAKQSGYGYLGSPDGHRQFTQARVVTARK